VALPVVPFKGPLLLRVHKKVFHAVYEYLLCTCVYRGPIQRMYIIYIYTYKYIYTRACLRRVGVIYETSNRFRSYTPGFRFEALTRYNVRIRGRRFDFPMLLFFILFFRCSLFFSTIYAYYMYMCVRVCVSWLRSLQMINNIRQPRQIQNRNAWKRPPPVRQPLVNFIKGCYDV